MKYLKIFTDFRSAMEPLTDEEAGRLFRAMLLYAENGTESELLGGERYLWNVARQNIDREAEAYAAKTGILRENGKKGAAARWNRAVRKDDKCLSDHGKDGQDNDNTNEKNNDNEKGNDISFFREAGKSAPKEEPVITVLPEKKETCPPLGRMGSLGETEKREGCPSLEEVVRYVRDAYLPVDAEHFYNYYEANGWHMGQQPMRDWKAAVKAWARNAPVAPRPAKPREKSTLSTFQDLMEWARLEDAKKV